MERKLTKQEFTSMVKRNQENRKAKKILALEIEANRKNIDYTGSTFYKQRYNGTW